MPVPHSVRYLPKSVEIVDGGEFTFSIWLRSSTSLGADGRPSNNSRFSSRRRPSRADATTRLTIMPRQPGTPITQVSGTGRLLEPHSGIVMAGSVFGGGFGVGPDG